MSRSYYSDKIIDFMKKSSQEISKSIIEGDNHSSIDQLQNKTWDDEIIFLKKALTNFDRGHIVFEYYLPRTSYRTDTIILIDNIVFVIEFKISQEHSSPRAKYKKEYKKQLNEYIFNLKSYHEESWDRICVPILVVTGVKHSELNFCYNEDDKQYNILCCNSPEDLISILNTILEEHPGNEDANWEERWMNSKFNRSPSIIQAAGELFRECKDKNIKGSATNKEKRQETTQKIVEIIEQTITDKKKSIIFVTGIPGAGKTLVGLELSISLTMDNRIPAVLLSGNDPFVKVIKKSISNNKDSGRGDSISHSFIQTVINFKKDDVIPMIKSVSEDNQSLDMKEDCKMPTEDVIIFDEAQRAWSKERIKKRSQYGKPTVLNDINFPYSEAGLLMWAMDQKESACIVCLIGGGQEIHDGEAGVVSWLEAVSDQFLEWDVYIAPNFCGMETDVENIAKLKEKIMTRWNENEKLHLAINKRALRTEALNDFVSALLNCNTESAKNKYSELKEKYPIVITRDLETARCWIRKKRTNQWRGGLLMSSKAARLRALGLEMKKEHEFSDSKLEGWFLARRNHYFSSDMLEVALSEFFVQGLEIDWACVVWDADFRYEKGEWKSYSFGKVQWNPVTDKTDIRNHKNGYRVLLTRARRGIVIVVPEGSKKINDILIDESRKPEWYDNTYDYLTKKIGIMPIE